MPPSVLFGRDRDAGEDDRELRGDGGERVGDPPLRDATAGIDGRAEAAPDRAARR